MLFFTSDVCVVCQPPSLSLSSSFVSSPKKDDVGEGGGRWAKGRGKGSGKQNKGDQLMVVTSGIIEGRG